MPKTGPFTLSSFPSLNIGDAPLLPSDTSGDFFSNFIEGKKNSFVLAQCRAFRLFNPQHIPLFLRSPACCGKSMLLTSLHVSLKAQIQATNMQQNTVPIFHGTGHDLEELFQQKSYARQFLRGCQAVLIDDIDMLEKNMSLQKELCVLIDFMSLNKKAFVATCSDKGQALLSTDLFSRLSMGLLVDIAEPDLDVRLKISRDLNQKNRLNMNQDAVLLIARRCTNLRLLQGVFSRIQAMYQHNGMLATLENVQEILSTGILAPALTSDMILSVVAAYFGYSSKDLKGSKRQGNLVLARQLAMYLCRNLLAESYAEIGHVFGGKNHSTAIYAVKNIMLSVDSNKDMNKLVTELTQKCKIANTPS